MADVILDFGARSKDWQSSEPNVLIATDSTLIDFDGAQETSDHLNMSGAGAFDVFVDVTPEGGQAVVLKIEASPDNTSDDWYAEWDGVATGVGEKEYVFATDGAYALSFEGTSRWIRVVYGFRGGTGAAATLKVTVQGRRGL